MKRIRIILDFIRLVVPAKIEFGKNVYERMNSNERFGITIINMAEFTSINDLLENRYQASLSGGKEETFLLHQAETNWDNFMRKVVRDVERIADGDGGIMLNAGFNLAKQPIPSVRSEFSAERGEKPNSVLLRRQAADGAKSYIWQMYIGTTPENEAEWKTIEITTKASVLIEGLTPLTKCWFRVAVVTPQGTSSFSDPIMLIIV